MRTLAATPVTCHTRASSAVGAAPGEGTGGNAFPRILQSEPFSLVLGTAVQHSHSNLIRKESYDPHFSWSSIKYLRKRSDCVDTLDKTCHLSRQRDMRWNPRHAYPEIQVVS